MIMRSSSDLSTSDFPDWDGVAIENLAVEYCKRGENQLEAKEYTQARSAYRIAIECSPKLTIAHSGMARANYHLGNYQAALVSINIAIAGADGKPFDCDAQIDLYYQRALITKALNDEHTDVADFPAIFSPSPPDLAQERSPQFDLVDSDNERLALANFDRHIDAHPEDPDGYCYRGMCYDRLEHYLLALADFDRAIALKPRESLFHHARGRTYRSIGNFGAAIADYDLVILLEPQLASVYVDRAEIHHLSGDCQQALADCDRAIGLNPQLTAAYFQRGITQAELGSLDAALADYTEAIDRDRYHLGAYIQRSWIYFRRGDYAQAIADCELVNSGDRSRFQAHYLLGVIHCLTGLRTKAIEDFTRTIELAPNYVAARYHLGVIYHEFSDLTAASHQFAQAKLIQARRMEQSIDLDETGLCAEGLALYYSGELESARTLLNLAALFAKRYDNNRVHSQISNFINRHYSN
jgi:tetratricopeptide (TPR) repeat protein